MGPLIEPERDGRPTSTFDTGGDGGEEIAIVFTQTTAQGVSEVTERLRQRLADVSHLHQGNGVKCTASFGISVCDGRGATPHAQELLDRADRALYQAKRMGRNCVVPWTPELDLEPSIPAEYAI